MFSLTQIFSRVFNTTNDALKVEIVSSYIQSATAPVVDGNLVTYNGTSGLVVQDSGVALTAISTAVQSGANAGASGVGIFYQKSGTALQFKKLIQGTGITITDNNNGTVTITGSSTLSSTDDLAEGSTNKYFSNALARAALSNSAPIAYNSSTGVISITQATTSTNGYLSSTDWNTFNGKQAAGSYITALTGDVSASGPGSASATISNLALSKLAALTANRVLTSTSGGVISASSVTDTTLGYLDATSSVQTQLDGMAKLVGRSGGQTLKGDTASAGSLTLSSTAHATKGTIVFGTSKYDEANNRLGINITPSYSIHLKNVGDSLAESLALEGSGSSAAKVWIHYIDGSGNYSLYNPGETVLAWKAEGTTGRIAMAGGSVGHPDASMVTKNQAGRTGDHTISAVAIGSQTGALYSAHAADESLVWSVDTAGCMVSCAANEASATLGTAVATLYLKVKTSSGATRYIPLVTTPN